MYYAAQLGKKINRIRKKNWSAPTIMGIFIIICMIIIFSFESLGLSNKERNLDNRITSPEKLIKVISNEVKIAKSCKNNNTMDNDCITNLNSDHLLNGKIRFKILAEKDKEKHLIEMQSILVDAANYQFHYENNITIGEIEDNSTEQYFIFDV